MFIQDLRQEFYNVLMGKRILIIVNYDIDAICASKILQSLFKYDHMVYSMVPIMGIAGLKRAFEENREDVKYVILINCGGCIDLVELLQPDEDVIFFVCDSHRPLDVCNIYSDRQVCMLTSQNPEEKIPEFDSIFRESDDESENEEDEDSENENLDFAQRHEKRIIKQREKRSWEQERDRIMFDYTQYSYYGRSSSMTIFELAWKLSKDSIEFLWWAIVGTTEQLVLGKIESSTYTLELDNMQSHVSRLANKTNDINNQSAQKISFENDLHLALYRHWSVHESMRYSMYCACKLKLWTLRGEKRLQELFVEMGLPLIQAKQTFSSMDMILRQEFYQMIEKLAEKYDIPEITYGSFTLHFGYRNKFSAADYVYAMLAILESVKKDKTPEDCFLEALDSLPKNNKDILTDGIDSAKLLLSAIFRQVQSSLEMHQIHSAGPFLYYILTEENPYFSYPYGLTFLAKFILNGYCTTSRNRRASDLPLVASCPIDVEHGLNLLVGIPPISEDSPKNFFGKAFEQAAQKSNSLILQDFFETSVIQIRQSDLTKFLDALTVLLS
ncbi:cell division control protein 45 homolog [Condylostylus longicornis]|uniref:cell division control protein 45 homolog n=1 Tax=Condylostylus longicornis TaxID=2530218 RepID=UPI00244E5030|nr:cell division control protein 45 homolog [Condylostylus longicornis]